MDVCPYPLHFGLAQNTPFRERYEEMKNCTRSKERYAEQGEYRISGIVVGLWHQYLR